MMKETRATVYVSDTPAATLVKSGGTTAFSYLPSYLNSESSRPVATTLPLTSQTQYTPHGSLPAFFSGLGLAASM
ncbi:HipA N-terminal domain-containing protein [Corynebacterium falsenii]|uniref:HipA N-terminal domain-containing protein n=1 Tax=Corynebacterium falsenii TaxID=108486 RepID=UPI003C6BEEAF